MAPDTTKLEAETRNEIDTKLTEAGIPYATKVTGAKRKQYLLNAEGTLNCKSQAYYEQIKCGGTHIISHNELHKVTPDAPGKSRFVLVDCVGVYNRNSMLQKMIASPMNRRYCA